MHTAQSSYSGSLATMATTVGASNPFQSTDTLSSPLMPPFPGTTTTFALASSPSQNSALLRRRLPAFRSRRVSPEDFKDAVPWHKTAEGKRGLRWSYWIFLGCMMLGILGTAALFVWVLAVAWISPLQPPFAIAEADFSASRRTTYMALPNHKYCLVLDENFDSLDTSIWRHEVKNRGGTPALSADRSLTSFSLVDLGWRLRKSWFAFERSKRTLTGD
jgi:hypothetical protein